MGASRTLRFDCKDLIAAGRRARMQGDFAAARAAFEDALAFEDAPAMDRARSRDHLAEVLVLTGKWAEAEAEIERSIREVERTAPQLALLGYVRLGMLRLRQGRPKEAAELFDRAEATEAVWLGRATLTYEGGSATCACGMLDRYLHGLPSEELPDRGAALELQTRAQASLGRTEQARAALDGIRGIAKGLATGEIRARVAAGEGAVALAAGDLDRARRSLEDAAKLYERAGFPFEATQARIDLARCLLQSSKLSEAAQEARAALSAAQSLGAAGEAERAGTLLGEIDAASQPPPPVAGLTRRETEVLALVAEGLSNAEIGERLFVSEHTVKRHVANILGKLDLPSRAAAAARYAGR